jgi:hypothetical protein
LEPWKRRKLERETGIIFGKFLCRTDPHNDVSAWIEEFLDTHDIKYSVKVSLTG